MRVYQETVPNITASVAAIAAAQAPTLNTPLTLVSSPFVIATVPDITANLSRRIQLHGVGDVSAVTFKITGLDRIGSVITENLVGPGAGANVLSVQVYSQVTSIVPLQTSANTLQVGWGTESVSRWVNVGNRHGHFTWLLRVFFASGGTANYDIEGTSEDMNGDIGLNLPVSGDDPDDIVVLNSTSPLVNTNYTSNNDTPWAWVRLKVHSAAQPVVMRIIPSRTD